LAKRDYYEVLSVSRDVDEALLKKAYRGLALKYHPDRNPGDAEAEERFKEASEAYAILSDPEKRRAYDRFGFDAVNIGQGAGGYGDFGDLGGFGDVFGDLFGDLFGARGGRHPRPGRGQRGADLRYNLEIEIGDVLEGTEIQVKIPKMRPCSTCNSTGARPGTSPETCSRCQGTGQVVLQQGFFRLSRPCDTCGGQGEMVRDRCGDCRGSGRNEGMQTIKVRVPAGVDDGTRLRLNSEGEAGIAGGPPGDLYVVISVMRHSLFQRDGRDLHCDVPVSFVQAALGAEIDVPTLDSKIKLRVPEGTQSGKVMRLRGKGLPSLRTSSRGDQLLHIFVEVPAKLTKKQRELLEAYAEAMGGHVSPAQRGFLDKLRDLFD